MERRDNTKNERGRAILVKFAVCDDEPEMADYISDKLREYYPEKCEIKSYVDGKILLANIRMESFDAFFLDIGMPEIDGMMLAQKIREDHPYVKIIFVTNKEELAHIGYKYGAFRFVRKSKLEHDLCEAAYSLKDFFDSISEYLNIKTPEGEITTKIKNIKYFEVKGHTVTMVCDEKEYQVYGTMKEYYNFLKNRGFIQIHKSYLVNFRFILSIEKNDVKLSCGRVLPLSRKRVDDVKNKLREYLINIGE